jgi:hypothetical protein
MSKKHYVMIAREIGELIAEATPDQRALLVDLAKRLGTLFADNNPNFDYAKFVSEATGI